MRTWPRFVILIVVLCAGCSWDTTTPTSLPSLARDDEAVLVGAGDIALCGSKGTEATAALLDRVPGTIFTTGDNAYPSGSANDFRTCYEPTWGRHKARTYPSPGNHEYESRGGLPYFEYFGERAGPVGLGYYTYRLGGWQIYSLNSNIAVDAASPQGTWLQQALATSAARCTLAYWHHPRFSSGPHGDHSQVRPLWQALYAADADVIIAGHDHLYERFAPQNVDGQLDAVRGLRQFVVGTGGAELTSARSVRAHSDARWSAHGVLRLTLRADSYTWAFLTETGAAADVGGGLCH